MDNGTMAACRVLRMVDGGFVVYSDNYQSDPLSGRYNEPLYACSSMEELTKYISEKMTPIAPVEAAPPWRKPQ